MKVALVCDWFPPRMGGLEIHLRDLARELERRGHPVERWGDWNELAGHAHGITRDPRTGLLAGGFDPRSDGAAIGF